MKIFLPLLAVIAILTGCASTPPPTRTVKFDSEPQGVRVFSTTKNGADMMDGMNYLGTTPFEWKTEVDSDGTFKFQGNAIPFYDKVVESYIVFIAQPPTGATNLFVKKEIFHSATQINPASKVPDGIFFDLTKP